MQRTKVAQDLVWILKVQKISILRCHIGLISQNPGDFAHQPFSLAAVNGRIFKILSIYVVILMK